MHCALHSVCWRECAPVGHRHTVTHTRVACGSSSAWRGRRRSGLGLAPWPLMSAAYRVRTRLSPRETGCGGLPLTKHVCPARPVCCGELGGAWRLWQVHDSSCGVDDNEALFDPCPPFISFGLLLSSENLIKLMHRSVVECDGWSPLTLPACVVSRDTAPTPTHALPRHGTVQASVTCVASEG